jgi:hypothetical protein
MKGNERIMVERIEGADGFTSGAENTNRRPTLVEEGAQTAKRRGGRRPKAVGNGGEGKQTPAGLNADGAGKGEQGAASGGAAAAAIAEIDQTQPLAEGGEVISDAATEEGDDETRIEVSSEEVGGAGQPKKTAGKGKATQPDLIADMRIEELHAAALDFAGKRDARIAAGRDEKNAKDLLLAMMKKHNKEVYSADGLTAKIVHEKENIKVEVNKGDGEEE